MMKKVIFSICCVLFTMSAFAQTEPEVEPNKITVKEIGGIKVVGAKFSDENAIISVSGLRIGNKIHFPGTEISKAIKALWNLKLFSDIQILQEKTIGDAVFLEIVIKEKPRYSRHSYKGIKKSYHDDLNNVVNRYIVKGGIITDNAKMNLKNGIEDFLRDKGYLDATVKVVESPDKEANNTIKLEFDVTRNGRVKIQNITFKGNENVSATKLRKQMEHTKRKLKIFTASKLVQSEFEEDKKSILKYYNKVGFRDAIITQDSIYRERDGDLQIAMTINEGRRYYFRKISWKGNSIYDSKLLENVLGIVKGEVYNKELLDNRLKFSQDGRDISSLYMDEGYLFFNCDPAEVAIDGDSIDFEMRIYEGPQATIDKVTIKGNDRTHEHVIRRELFTLPGAKFSRTDVIRSNRQLANLGYFNPEKIGINTPVNPQRGTVDIEYDLEEKPSDQLELSAGWGGGLAGRGGNIIGTLGVTFNNFSLRNFFKKESWSPLPQGDGQRLSLRAQTNGQFYQSYNFSFSEPWLGGKKPNNFSVSGFYTKISNGNIFLDQAAGYMAITGGSVGLGTRLKKPDDNFIFNAALNYQNFKLSDYPGIFFGPGGEVVSSGTFNNINLEITLARNTINDPLFPKNGSRISLATKLTPPYSGLGLTKHAADESIQDKFRWLEFHKWRFNADWYTPIVGNLILKTYVKIGMVGYYNKTIGTGPFEKFQVGGNGFNNRQLAFTGNDIISSRGYNDNEIFYNETASGRTQIPGSVFNKMGVELRFPISLNPSSTIYALAFVEGTNAWGKFRDFNPFDLRRSAGLGLRVFLPMFGTLGFDYGLGFDKPNLSLKTNKIWDYGTFNIILGVEPD